MCIFKCKNERAFVFKYNLVIVLLSILCPLVKWLFKYLDKAKYFLNQSPITSVGIHLSATVISVWSLDLADTNCKLSWGYWLQASRFLHMGLLRLPCCNSLSQSRRVQIGQSLRRSSIVANTNHILWYKNQLRLFGSEMHDARAEQREKYCLIKLLNLNTKGKFIRYFETCSNKAA